MKLLVVNDDGVKAEGIKILVEKLMPYAEKIVVVAPRTEMSANSHALTIKSGLMIEKCDDIYPGVDTYSLNGTPSDCVVFAINELKVDIDMVVSGINRGYNLGDDIVYSGTVAAALEGLMKGKKALAFSCKYDSFEGAKYIDEVIKYLSNNNMLNEKVVWNINMPAQAFGIKITHQAKSTYKTMYTQKEDKLYYSVCDKSASLYDDPTGDIQTIKQKYISISPLTFNMTSQDIYNKYHK